MSSTITTIPSSLGRYRPAVLAVTILAAGYTVYCIHNNFWASTRVSKSAPALQRRNAVHRRHHRRRIAHSPELDDRRMTIDSAAILEQFRSGPEHYGNFSTTVGDTTFERELGRSNIPSMTELAAYFPNNQRACWETREAYEEALLCAFLCSTFPPGTILLDGEGVNAFLIAFEAEGFVYADIMRRCFARWNECSLSAHPMSIAYQTQGGPIRNADQLRELQQQANDMQFRLQDLSVPVSYYPNNGLDGESEHSWHAEDENDESQKEGQNLLNLLYQISENQAKNDGFAHRGVTCNSCDVMPIRGVRYRCTNCADYDLCEQCEALQLHPKTHLFYKVRIPAPFLGNPRQPQPVWYPGRPRAHAQRLSKDTRQKLCDLTGFESAELEALWEQFKCLAASDWLDDPNGFEIAIDRKTFGKCFVPSTSIRPPPPNLIYDRMFDFYDTNGDGYIGFEEFLTGLSSMKSKNPDEKMKRIFQGYDLDGDGYLSRRDLLYMFRAFYALTKELVRDVVPGIEEDLLEGGGLRDVVMSSQPLSSAYATNVPPAERSRFGDGKIQDAHGDLVVYDDIGAVRENELDEGDHNQIVGDFSERSAFGNIRNIERNHTESMLLDEVLEQSIGRAQFHRPHNVETTGYENEISEHSGHHSGHSSHGSEHSSMDGLVGLGALIREQARAFEGDLEDSVWPPEYVHLEDVGTALGSSDPLHTITDHAVRRIILEAAVTRICRKTAREEGVNERWERRQFYLDEEDGDTVPKMRFEPSNKFANGMNGTYKSTVIDEGAAASDQMERRKSALALIRDSSSSLRRFRSKVSDEAIRRSLADASRNDDSAAMVDLLMAMTRQDFEPHTIASTLVSLGKEFDDALSFVNWFVSHIFSMEKEMKNIVAATTAEDPLSMRSRSPSKVRFEDGLNDDEFETRSATSLSSRSRTPLGERWGGYEIPGPENDVGREILYQMTQESLNELLDPLFKQREDLGMEVKRTAFERNKFRTRLEGTRIRKLAQRQITRFQRKWRTSLGTSYEAPRESVGDELKHVIAREHKPGSAEWYITLEDIYQLGLLEPGFDATDEDLAHFVADKNLPSTVKSIEFLRECLRSVVARRNGASPASPATGFSDVVRDLHNAIASFTEKESDNEDNVMQKSLRKLLAESGYETTETTENGLIEDADDKMPDLEEISVTGIGPLKQTDDAMPNTKDGPTAETEVDPTLPQNRPNSNTPNPPTSASPLPKSSATPSADEGEEDQSSTAFIDKIKYLAMIDCVAKEDEERGGPGRLSFAEFEEIMQGRKGKSFEILGSWIDLASF